LVNDTTFWDDFGGFRLIKYLWNDSTGWYLRTKVNDIFNERGLRTLISQVDFIDNKWDTVFADRYFFEYKGSIWKAMHYERYDTALMKWQPAYDHILSDFTYILNTQNIEKKVASTGLHIIPNPSRNSILIRLNDETEGIKSLTVYDISGRVMYSEKFPAEQKSVRLDISAFKKGTYIINVENGINRNRKGKFIKN